MAITRRFFALIATSFVTRRASALGALRKVAVLSVTGPSDWQETIDAAEVALVAALRAKGLAVVPLADSKSFTSSNWQAAYANLQAGKLSPGRNSNTGQRASRNTLVLADPGQSDSRRGYSATFCRTAGELSRQMGADAAVLLTIGVSRMQIKIVQILMIDPAGACVFREQVQIDRKDFLRAAINKAVGDYASGSRSPR